MLSVYIIPEYQIGKPLRDPTHRAVERARIFIIVSMRNYIIRGGDDSGFLRQMAAIIGSKNRKKLLQSIEVPTFIVHGDIDPLIKVKNAYASHKLIKNSQLHIVPNMGHLLDIESYNKFQTTLIDFLSN